MKNPSLLHRYDRLPAAL